MRLQMGEAAKGPPRRCRVVGHPVFLTACNAPTCVSGTFRLGCSSDMVAWPQDTIIRLPLQTSMGHPSFASGDAANSYALPPRHPPRPVSNAREPHSQPHSQDPEGTRPASTSTLLTARQASGAAMRRPHSAAPAVSMTSSALVPGSVQQARTGPGSSGSEQEGDWQPLGERPTAPGGEAGCAVCWPRHKCWLCTDLPVQARQS